MRVRQRAAGRAVLRARPGGIAAPGAGAPLLPVAEQAVAAQRDGRAAEAERLCHEVLELAPAQPEALATLWRICSTNGRGLAAEALLRRLVQFHPNTLWATHELTLALLAKGAVAEAEIHARNGVRIAPENAQSHNLLGMVMTEANRPQTGEYHYRRVIELSGMRDPIVLANLAWNLKNQGRMAEARQLYEEVGGAGAGGGGNPARLGADGGSRPQFRTRRRSARPRRAASPGQPAHHA